MRHGNQKSQANYQPLSPVTFLLRTAEIFPNYIAWVYGKKKCTYKRLLERSKSLASSLKLLGLKKGNVV